MTGQTISAAGTRFVAGREAVMLHAYPDVTGTWTVGIGHTAAAGPPVPIAGMSMTAEAAYALFAADIARIYEPKLRSLVKVPLAQHEFDALDSFIYNVGGGNLAHSTLLARLNAGDKASAADHFMDWTRSKGVELDGLKKRRAAEREVFLTGQYPDALPELGHTGQAMSQAHTIAKGAMGADVVTLQRQLAAAGFAVKADGAFGAGTDGAVRAFQAARGLPVDGVVGLKTWMALEHAQPAPKPLVLPPIPPGPDPAIKLPVLAPGSTLLPGPVEGGQPWPMLQPGETIPTPPTPRPSFWAGLVAALTPKPKTEA